ncbi:MAG: anti-sigma factor domain-containing protein [Chthoniobacterales bacterium]
MNRDQIEELACLDALGALDGEDVAAWEQVSTHDKEASALRDELADVAARLSLLASQVEAPAALRRRVMDRIFGGQAESDPTSTPRPFGYAAWAAAAAIVLLVVAGASATTRQKENVMVRDARTNPQNLTVALQGYGDYAGVKANVLWDSGQRGWYVQAHGLPTLPVSHCYRVWAVDADGAVHDCGELPLRPGGLARRFVRPGDAIDSMQGFAVSVEPAGTVPSAPTSPAVLISTGLKG